MVFPVVMYWCESWTVKKAECQRTDAFELWCWRRLLRVPCKEIQPVHSEGDQPWDFFGRNDAKAETPVLWPPHAKSWLIGKDSVCQMQTLSASLMLGGIGGRRRRGLQRMRWRDGITGWMASLSRWTWVWVNSRSWWWTGRPGVLHGVAKSWTGLSDWTELTEWLMMLNIFSCAYLLPLTFLVKCLVKSFTHFSIGFFGFFLFWEYFMYSRCKPKIYIYMWFAKECSPPLVVFFQDF